MNLRHIRKDNCFNLAHILLIMKSFLLVKQPQKNCSLNAAIWASYSTVKYSFNSIYEKKYPLFLRVIL